MTDDVTRVAHKLTDPEERRKMKSKLDDVAAQFQLIADRREVIKECITEISEEYGIDKKYIRQLAVTLHKSNYNETQQKNRAFETFWEVLIEGSYRDDESNEEVLAKQGIKLENE